MSARGWWYRASREQKLAQIDGGIECGLTGREVAVCSGIDRTKNRQATILSFAKRHGRNFPGDGLERAVATIKRKGNMRRDYFQGERDFWNDHPEPTADVPELVFE